MRTFRKYFWFIPTIIWMAVIFGFSGQEGETSAGVSLIVSEKVAVVLHETVVQEVSVPDLVEILHPNVRKTAHMTEYAILYFLLFLSFLQLMSAVSGAAVSILVSLVYSCTDEIHQAFVAGRDGNYLDVCVDMTGVLVAVMIVLFLISRRSGREARRADENERLS